MSSHTQSVFLPDGSVYHGGIHPEAGEALEAILRRDLRTMRKHKCRSFIRKPYADLDEIGMISFMPNAPQEVAAVVVIGITPGETNARIPVEPDLIESIVKSRRHLDLYSLKTKKGFGGQSK